jgi:hypothetical protein
MKREGEAIETGVNKPCWMSKSLLAPVDVMGFQTTRADSNLDLTNVKYSTCKKIQGRKCEGYGVNKA